MQVTEIVVNAGRTFNHPHEQYSNLKPSVTLKATLDTVEDPADAVKKLQAQAEGLVEDHKQSMLKSIEELYDMGEKASRLKGLQRQLTDAQKEMDEIRTHYPELAQMKLPEGGTIGSRHEEEFDPISTDDGKR